MIKYRLRQYNPNAWCIEQLYTYGEDSKKAGQQEWKIIKYPGDLANASKRLLSLVIGTDESFDVKQLQTAVQAAEREIVAHIEDYVRLKL